MVGAYERDGLVGFGLSFLAREPRGRLYQYSQTVAVAPEAQTRGVGRRLKQAQREAALGDGLDLLRWVFDPMHARNGHFNLDVLGGRVRTLQRSLYGHNAPGRDAGEPTDRLVVDWELDAPAAPGTPAPELALPPLRPGESRDLGHHVAVGVPADWRGLRIELGPAEAASLRARVVDALEAELQRGGTVVSCRRIDAATAVYLLARGGKA